MYQSFRGQVIKPPSTSLLNPCPLGMRHTLCLTQSSCQCVFTCTSFPTSPFSSEFPSKSIPEVNVRERGAAVASAGRVRRGRVLNGGADELPAHVSDDSALRSNPGVASAARPRVLPGDRDRGLKHYCANDTSIAHQCYTLSFFRLEQEICGRRC